MAENDPAHAAEEWGDLLFCLVNYARMNGIDSEESLRAANAKFERRFKGMESDLKRDGHTGFNPGSSAGLAGILEETKKHRPG
jgi:uncharacterized protein YabN with tetrapyrrole methylase and pyrophosphatase domain